MNNKKIAVIGCGRWGGNLVRTFSELGVLKAISDENESRLKELQAKYNIDVIKTDYNDILNDPDIVGVAIATPAITHHDIAKKALQKGKDVFVEKPISLTTADAEDLISIAKSKDRILMVDHLLQYHSAVIKLKELIDQGALGKLQYIYSNRLNIGCLRTEENILWSFAPHDISVILGLVEKEPEYVSAEGQAYLQDDIYDTTITHLNFKNRLRAHIFVSWLHPFKEQKLVVIGDKAMAVFNDISADEKLVLYPHKVEWIKQTPVANKADKQVVEIEKTEPLKNACNHFLDCIEKRSTPKTDGAEALSVLRVLNMAQKSLDEDHNEKN